MTVSEQGKLLQNLQKSMDSCIFWTQQAFDYKHTTNLNSFGTINLAETLSKRYTKTQPPPIHWIFLPHEYQPLQNVTFKMYQ